MAALTPPGFLGLERMIGKFWSPAEREQIYFLNGDLGPSCRM